MKNPTSNYLPYFFKGHIVGYISLNRKHYKTKRSPETTFHKYQAWAISTELFRNLKNIGVYKITIVYENNNFVNEYSLSIHEFRQSGFVKTYNNDEQIIVPIKEWVKEED